MAQSQGSFDTIVAGLGGMGSAVLARAALRGARVLGIEQFERGHDLGASAGDTRIIRQAYFEDPAYVPLLFRAYELWRDLEARTGEEIMRLCGLLLCGMPDGDTIAGATSSAQTYGIAVEHLASNALRARYPALRVEDDEVGLLEPGGGVVFPERAVAAHLGVAEGAGAKMRFGAGVRAFESDGTRVRVTLTDGSVIDAASLVLSTGPWIEREFANVGIPLEIQRNVQVWFAPRVDAYRDDVFPGFLLDRASLPAPLYGFPDFGDGVKAAFHALGMTTRAEALDRAIDVARDVAPVARGLEGWMPGAAGAYLRAKACMYALTSDRHFVIDRHPEFANVVLCGGF